MPTTSQPFGIQPIRHPSGTLRPSAYYNVISSGYGSNILYGQTVLMTTSGLLNPVVANNVDYLGIFAGVKWTDTTGQPHVSNYWPASTTYQTGSLTAFVFDDPTMVFQAQADGTMAQTVLGDQTNITNFAAGSTTTGLSACTVSATPVGNGVQGQFWITNLGEQVNNAWGDNYVILELKMARQMYVANKTSAG